MSQETFLLVLDDGETYSSLEGCMIIAVPDTWDGEKITDALQALNDDDDSPDEVTVITRFT